MTGEKITVESSRGRLSIRTDSKTAAEFDELQAMSAGDRAECFKAIMRYVETGSKNKLMKPFEGIARAYRAEFVKIRTLKFGGEPLPSVGHLRMPDSMDEMRENPLFLDDLSVFLPPFSDKGRINMEQYDELKTKHPHTQIEESLFRKMDSPVVAFSLFVKCCESGVYPPVDLLHWVADSMKRFIAGDGKEDLNEVFGFIKKGKGNNRRDAFDVARETKSDALELMWMATLIDYFDLTVDEAAAFMARTGKYEGKSTYERKWYGEWNEYMKNHDQFRSIYQKIVLDRIGGVDDESKLRFLEKFGPYGKKNDTLPLNIEKFLKKHGRL